MEVVSTIILIQFRLLENKKCVFSKTFRETFAEMVTSSTVIHLDTRIGSQTERDKWILLLSFVKGCFLPNTKQTSKQNIQTKNYNKNGLQETV